MTQRLKIVVSGKVQGVFFRASTQKIASQHAIKGYVRNLPDGRVEILADGATEALENFLDWCKRGPMMAKVEQIEIDVIQAPEDYQHFEIR